MKAYKKRLFPIAGSRRFGAFRAAFTRYMPPSLEACFAFESVTAPHMGARKKRRIIRRFSGKSGFLAAPKTGANHPRVLRVDAGLVQSLRQTSLFTVRGVLVHDALGDRFINSGGGGAQLRTGGGDALDQSDLIFLDGSLNARLHHTIPQVLLLAHLHTLHGGLDVRQLPSPPW